MLRFVKGPQPHALTEWQATPAADWSSLRSEDFWPEILADQSHLCSYCQRVIPMKVATGPRMHVEHWTPQASGERSLEWGNLLGVCPGDESAETGIPRGERHCDTSRGAAALFLHPVAGRGPSPLDHLAYTTEGEAVAAKTSGAADRVSADIEALNLSAERLMRGRISVYSSLKGWLDRKGWTESNLRRAYRDFEAERGARRPAYAEVARYYLRRWARKQNVTL